MRGQELNVDPSANGSRSRSSPTGGEPKEKRAKAAAKDPKEAAQKEKEALNTEATRKGDEEKLAKETTQVTKKHATLANRMVVLLAPTETKMKLSLQSSKKVPDFAKANAEEAYAAITSFKKDMRGSDSREGWR